MVLENNCKVDVTVLNRSGINLKIKDKNSGDELDVEHGKDKGREFTALKQNGLEILTVEITADPTDTNPNKDSNSGHVIMEFIVKDAGPIKYLKCSETDYVDINKGGWGLLVMNTTSDSFDETNLPTNVEVGIDDPH